MIDLPEIDGPETFEDAILEINENYDLFGDGKNGEYYTLNCMLCTTAYEMRRRGYDVEAQPITEDLARRVTDACDDASSYKESSEVYASMIYKNPEIVEVPTNNISDLAGYMEQNLEPNTRGNLMFKYAGSTSGHSIIYEVDSNGDVKLMDSQVSTVVQNHGVYTDDASINSYATRMGSVYLMRTDNLEFSEEGVGISVREN